MANPPLLLTADGRLDGLMPYIRPRSVGVVDKIGSDLGHCQYRRRRRSPGERICGRSIAHDLAGSRRMARQTVNEKR
jgi:hypothetical protein